MNPRQIIADNVARIRQRIAAAAARSGRSADAVKLIAVTKYVGLDEIAALREAGCSAFGESQPQTLWKKAATLPGEPIDWHFIGHLQRNKVRRTVPLVACLHSGDSLRLLEELNAEVQRASLPRFPVLLEVNVSGDESKHGFAPGELEALWPALAALVHLEIRGLMGMAALEGGVDVARQNFQSLRECRDRLQKSDPKGIALAELSMGMSGDFEVAIEEGATMVRVGSSLFEGVE